MANDTETIMKMLELMRRETGAAGWESYSGEADPFDVLKEQYKEAERTAKSAKDWERYQTAFAKALPEFTKGIINADAAFKSGDVFGGTAAIMDICATTSNFIGGLSAAGGPPGAVVGAIFSMVSMILNLFKPKAPSLTQQIENLLRMLKAEGLIDDLRAAQDGWETFSNALATAKPGDVPYVIGLMNPMTGTPFHVIRQAAHWLKNPKNYSQDLWTAILATQCQFYIDVMLTCTLLTQRVCSFCRSGASEVGFRGDPVYDSMEQAIGKFMFVINACHPVQMEFLTAIRPLARDKGLVWSIQESNRYSRRPHIPGDPRRDVPGGKDPISLGEAMEAITVSTVTPGPTENPFEPPLAVFGLSPRDPWPWVEWGIDLLDQESHNYWGSVSNQPMVDWHGDIIEFEKRRNHPFGEEGRKLHGMFGDWLLSSNTGWKQLGDNLFYDIWATPGREAGETFLLTARGDRISHYVHRDKDSSVTGTTDNPLPAGYKVGRVRVVRALRPFPDEDHAVLKDVGAVVYGLCEVSAGKSDIAAADQRKNTDHMELRAYYYNRQPVQYLLTEADKIGRSFLSPWPNIRGIGVDRRYLWVFRVGEIACATHTSIKACLDKKQAEPSWNTYTIPRRPFDKNDKEEHVYDGLLDLAPCDDGTLTAAVGFKSGKLYGMRPRIDRQAKTFVIDRWRPLDKELFKNPRGPGWAMRVHKQPVFCWTMLEGLMEALEKASTTLTIEESVLGGETAKGTINLPIAAAEDIMVTFASIDKEAILAPDRITIRKGKKSQLVSIKTKPTGQDEVATITAVLSTSFSTFQPLEVTSTLKTVPVTFTVDSVRGGNNARGIIALSMPAAEDIAVTFAITSPREGIFLTPDPITIKKGNKSHPVSIKTNKTAKRVQAFITATACSPSQPFELTAEFWATKPS